MDKVLAYIFIPLTIVSLIISFSYPNSHGWLFPLLFLVVCTGAFIRKKQAFDTVLAYGCLVLFVASILYYWI